MTHAALRNAALAYAERGWRVLPLRPGGKAPLGQLVPNGKDNASDDLATVFRWWEREPRANVGLACGASGWVALDVDPRNGGDETLWELEVELGELPQTIEAHSGGGGRHLLYRHPGGVLRGQAGEGVDVKDAGYIVAPPSIHPSGGRYVWSVDGDPDEVALAELPEPWLRHLRQPARSTRTLDLSVRVDHDDPLRRVPAAVYVARLTGRDVTADGWVRCPFHKGGQERTPSLKVSGTVWACYACPPIGGRRVLGGNVYDFAGLLAGYALPLRGADFLDVQARLARALGGAPLVRDEKALHGQLAALGFQQARRIARSVGAA
jgi:hypothetical protein